MEIVKQRAGDVLHVQLTGRLDNHWSEPLDEALAEMIREGAHHLRLDLTGVNYLSSAGIGVLMNAYRDVLALHGTFLITAASDRVRTVLQLVALDTLLFAGAPEQVAPQRAAGGGPKQIASKSAQFEVHALGASGCDYQLLGKPGTLTQTSFDSAHSIAADQNVFAVGVGALGHEFDECRNLFGEFVALAGAAAYMPTDGTSTPDYMTKSGELVPEIQALYAIVFRGAPSHLLRFEATAEGGEVPLSEVVDVCASVAGTPEFGVVMAAEVSGLVCALLRRSPAVGEVAQLEFPAVREWLSYMPEHEYSRHSSVVVGFASAQPSAELRPFVRPVSDGLHGHVHAAVTAFRSLPRGKVEIADVLAQAFQPRSVVSVVHLLRDTRPIEGAGESEFHRGACWLFPLNGAAS